MTTATKEPREPRLDKLIPDEEITRNDIAGVIKGELFAQGEMPVRALVNAVRNHYISETDEVIQRKEIFQALRELYMRWEIIFYKGKGEPTVELAPWEAADYERGFVTD